MSMTAKGQTRLAIIGCGAVAQQHLLPALRRIGWRPDVLVDPSSRNLVASKRLIRKSQSLLTVSDWATATDAFDAAIVAAPHALHGPIGLALAQAGKHIFMEKPLAVRTSECEELLAAAAKANLMVSVGLLRRYLYATNWTKALVCSGLLGRIRSFHIREGFVFNWATSTDGLLRPAVAGGGVLMDTGAHTLDQLLWWLGDIAKAEYRDDGESGIEADCVIDCEMQSGAIGRVEISRSRDLPNTCRINGTDGFVEVHLSRNEVIACSDNVQGFIADGLCPGIFPQQRFPELFSAELSDFKYSIIRGAHRGVHASESLRSIALIERCYAHRGALRLPWNAALPAAEIVPALPRGSLAVITGATGFIGGRLAERLLEQGSQVRCLVRNYGAAVRLARLPVDIRRVDLADAATVSAAIEGADFVFHCAYDSRSRPQNLAACNNLAAASLAHDVKRFLLTSTFSVYEPFPVGSLTEDTPDGDRRWVYTRTKLELEHTVLAATRTQGLQGTILQPSIVYGPFSRPWTNAPADMLLYGTVVLPNSGEGLCNALYVDDLIDAMIIAAIKPTAIGERFVISGPETVTWRTFFERFAEALGTAGPQYRPADQIARENSGLVHDVKMVASDPKRLIRIAARSPSVRNMLQAGLDSLPKPIYDMVSRLYFGSAQHPVGLVHLPDPQLLSLYTSTATAGSEKARRLLGYAPRFDFATGMAITAKYLTWAYGRQLRSAVSPFDRGASDVGSPASLINAA
jgi:predicted dehydrogenase/nucleoside-diphosphate-sugar epimerase